MKELRGPAALALALLAGAELLGMGVWFTASALSGELQRTLDLSGGQATALTALVQLGFVGGTALAALLNIADILPARLYFAVSALLAGVSNAALVLAPDFGWAAATRLATGVFLAGVYPPAMKMAATWFKADRGLAIGAIVGALTLGKALPYLGVGVDRLGWRTVVLAASAFSIVGGLTVLAFYRDGPHVFERRPFAWNLVGEVARNRPVRLATAGYLGHMWELYAVWTAIQLFYRDVLSEHPAHGPGLASLLAFSTIGIGAAGSLVAGRGADRWGRERIAALALLVSGSCALSVGWLQHASLLLLVPVTWVWGFSVVADSAQFSALVTEVAPRHAAGTALTLQTSLGFLLTMVTIQGTPWLAERWGWGPAFSALAVGPAFGIVAMVRLAALRRAGGQSQGG
ncbi:MAG: MFS transporter [Gemmatimonadota bacterium]